MRVPAWLLLAAACQSEVEIKHLDPADTVTTNPSTTPTVATTDTGSSSTTPTETTPTETTPTETTPIETTPTQTTPTQTTPIETTTTGTIPPVVCTSPSSWRDTLPPLPAAVPLPPGLSAGGGALATCTGDPVYVSDPTTFDEVSTVQAHNGGQWYFEVTPAAPVTGSSGVGVFASPANEFDLLFVPWGIWGTYPWSVASGSYTGGAVGIAADLDAGVVGIYENGALVDQQTLSLDPGVGAFHAGGEPAFGDSLRFNYGSQPFTYDPPAGYAAWSGGGTGPCVSDPDVPAPAAPITFDTSFGYEQTTFQSDVSASEDLVFVGLYDSGSVSGWTWGPGGTPVPTGNQQNGSITVHLNRTTPTALVLSTYEPTDWTLDVDPGADLRSVTVYAMHPQTVTGAPSGVPITIHTICTNGDGGFCTGYTGENFYVAGFQWPFDDGGGATQDQIDMAEQETCLPLKLFGGIYESQDVEID